MNEFQALALAARMIVCPMDALCNCIDDLLP